MPDVFLVNRRRAARRLALTQGRLLVTGRIVGDDISFSPDDCRSLPTEHQIADVGAYASGVRGHGVRLQAIIDRARVYPATMYLNVRDRSGKFAASLFRRDVEQLAIVVYACEGASLAREQGGPFRLVLPGYHDECRDIPDVAWLAFSDDPGKDTRRPSHFSADELVGRWE
jgi:DMSO/TMAO reductase YedYZ molybdopterin-dependent catalytic subunit